MKALLLAAGRGKRLRPITHTTPKYLIPLGPTTLLDRHIKNIMELGINEVGIVVHHLSELVVGHVKQKWRQINVQFITQESPLGTGNAVSTGKEFIGDSDFLLIYADNLFSEKAYEKIINHYSREGKPIIGTTEVVDPWNYGVCLIEKNNLVKIIEKPPSERYGNKVLTGIFVLNKSIWDYLNMVRLSPRGEYELTDAINIMSKEHSILCVDVGRPWIDVGRPNSLLKANQIILEELGIKVYIDKSVKLATGKIYDATICENVEVGQDSTIENSIIMDSTKIGKKVHIKHAIIGCRCLLGDNSTLIGKIDDPLVIGADTRLPANTRIIA